MSHKVVKITCACRAKHCDVCSKCSRSERIRFFGSARRPKYASLRNPQANATIERLRQVLGNRVRTYNLQETYVDDADPFMGILAAAAFAVCSTYHQTKEKSPGQLVFGRDMILPTNHIAYWGYIRQRKKP